MSLPLQDKVACRNPMEKAALSCEQCNAPAATRDAFRQPSTRLSSAPRQKGVTNTSNKQTRQTKKKNKTGKEEGKEEKKVPLLTAATEPP